MSQERELDLEPEESGVEENNNGEETSSSSEMRPSTNRSSSAVRIAKLEKILDNEMVVHTLQ